MVASTATASADAAPRASVRARALAPAFALAGLVVVSAVVRILFAWQHLTPTTFPDEYIYTALARGFVDGTPAEIRHDPAHFYALLAPLVDAPGWALGSLDAGYRAVQAINGVVMSLAAVPVYLLGRRLGVSAALSLGAAALALAVPDVLYVANTLAEPLAYPLALAAVLAGVAALERPSLRAQSLFLGFALLATLARLQFVALAPAFAAAAVVIGVRERRLRAVVREQLVPVGLCCAGIVVLVGAGLGYYSGAVDLGSPAARLDSAGANLLVLAAVAGWTIVPGAVLGLGLAFARPRSRRELAFAALTAMLLVGLVAEAALYGKPVHERYVFYVVPLLALGFGLYARRGWPLRLWHVLASVALLVVAAAVPLSDLGARGETNSTLLVALHSLRLQVGTPGTASLIALLAFTGGSLAVAALSVRPRLASGFAVVFAIALAVAASALATHFDTHQSRSAQRDSFGAGSKSWIDARGSDPVTLLETYQGRRLDALSQLFWNRSVQRVALLPGAMVIDAFREPRLQIAPDGALSLDGRPLTGRVAVDAFDSSVQLPGARKLASAPYFDLYRLAGPGRISLYVPGRYRDGWIAPLSAAEVWSARGGEVRFTVRLPKDADPGTLKAKVPGVGILSFRLRPGKAVAVRIPIRDGGHREVRLGFSTHGYAGRRLVAAKTSVPEFLPR